MALPPALQQQMDALKAANPDTTPQLPQGQPPQGGQQQQPQQQPPQAGQQQQPPQAGQQQQPQPQQPVQNSDGTRTVDVDDSLLPFFTKVGDPQSQQQPQTPQFAQPQQAQQPVPQTVPASGDSAMLQQILAAQQNMQRAIEQGQAGRHQVQTQPVTSMPGQQPNGQQPQQPQPIFNFGDVELTEDDQKFFGANRVRFEKLVQKLLRETVEPVLQNVNQKVDTGFGRIGQTVAMTRQQALQQAIAARIPDFGTISAQPQFRGFLEQVIPEVGATRAEILRGAIERGDVDLIATHVQRYKESQGAAGGSQPDLQALQQPGGQGRPTTPAPTQPRYVVTEADLQRAESEMTKGRLAPDKLTQLVEIYRAQLAQNQQAQAQARKPRFA